MTEKVETSEEIRRYVIHELRNMALGALNKVMKMVEREDWDQAIGALSAIEYVLRCAKEWK